MGRARTASVSRREDALPVEMDRMRAVDRPLRRAATLPRPLFTDPRVYDLEMERLFLRTWQCLGRADEIARVGDFRTYEIAGSGLVVVRTAVDELRAYHNVCRHRGTRLVEEASGSGLKVFQCPYHAWTYTLDGTLTGSPHMESVDFDPEANGLYPVQLETWRGFLFVNLNAKAAPLARYLGDFVPRAAPYPLETLRLAHRVTYEIQANWKFVVQNANECYHCPGVHPQLVRITPYTSGEEDMLRGPIFGGWMDLVDSAVSLTPSGTSSRRAFRGLSEDDRRRVYYYVLYPANFLSLLPDYVTLDRFIPEGPERTRLLFDLYVAGDEPDGADDAMGFWDTTNRQDWHICELAHKGARTVAYTQGRYSSQEDAVHAIDRFYAKEMGFLAPQR